MKKSVLIGAVVILSMTALAGIAYAGFGASSRVPVSFHPGHTHDSDGVTHGAPSHSGGTDSLGCHNGSVPYHCH